MKFLKKQKNIILLIFVLLSVSAASLVYLDYKGYSLIFKTLSILLMCFYYEKVSHKPQVLYHFVLFLIFLSGVLFPYKSYKNLCFLLFFVMRCFFILLIYKEIRKKNLKTFLLVLFLLIAILGVILTVAFINAFWYYSIIGTAIATSIILAVCFVNISKKWSFYLLVAHIIAVYYSAVFLLGNSAFAANEFTAITSLIFSITYFLTTESMVLKEKND